MRTQDIPQRGLEKMNRGMVLPDREPSRIGNEQVRGISRGNLSAGDAADVKDEVS
jgi:hypothetical protein